MTTTSIALAGHVDYSHILDNYIDANDGDEVVGTKQYDSAIERMVRVWNHRASEAGSTAEWLFAEGVVYVDAEEAYSDDFDNDVWAEWREEAEQALLEEPFRAGHILQCLANGVEVPEYRHYLGVGFRLWEGSNTYVITVSDEDPHPFFSVRRAEDARGLEVACSPDNVSDWCWMSFGEAVRRAELAMGQALESFFE